MGWKFLLAAGVAVVSLWGPGMAGAAVLGTAAFDAAAEIVVTDTAIDIDPDGTGPLAPQPFAPGATLRVEFDYLSDLPAGAADYRVDLRLRTSSLAAIFTNPFSIGPALAVVDLIPGSAAPLEPFTSSRVFPSLAPGGLQGVPPLAALFDDLTGGIASSSGSFVIQSAGLGPVPAGALTGGFDLDPGASASGGSGVLTARYAADALFRTIRDPLLAALPPSVSVAIDDTGLVQTGLFDNFVGMTGRLTFQVDVTATTPVPLPASLALLALALAVLACTAGTGRRNGKRRPGEAALAGSRSVGLRTPDPRISF